MRLVTVAAIVVLAAGMPLTAEAQPATGDNAADNAEAAKGLHPPKLKKFVEAAYPADKQKAGIGARVVVAIDVEETGRVGNVEVISPAGPDFDVAAVAAIGQFEFEPATLDGTPVPVKIHYAYTFEVKEIMVSLGPQINFEGVVTNRFTKVPQRGVKVKIIDLGVEGMTDEDGAFAFTD